MKTTKVDTWLPIFSGFYGTLWETDNDEEMEIENINEQRREKGLLKEVTWDDIEWDYTGYQKAVVSGVTNAVGEALKKMGMIKGFKLQKLSSPREYNFGNDSIEVEFTVTNKNKLTIKKYLEDNREVFAKYLEDHYTSYDGFFSSYSNDVDAWLADIEETVTHQHKLGAVLDFILRNDDGSTDIYGAEYQIYDDLRGNGVYLTAANYSELMKAA